MTTLFACSLVGLIALALSPAGCSLSRSGIAGDMGGGGIGGQGAGGDGGATTATMSTSSMGGGGSSSTGTGAGGCTPSVEDCLNGMDDDCDGHADCDDSDSCGNYECFPLPAGGRLVEPVASPGQCSGELMELTRSDCSQCECQVDEVGDCTHIAHLYDATGCGGTPTQSIQIMPGDTCTPSNTVAVNGQTVSVMAEPVGLDNATCSVDNGSASLTTRYLCALNSPGVCAGNQACSPPGAVSCILLDGDVACPAGFEDKEILYDTSRTECDCACEITEQVCPSTADTHLHANNAIDCPGQMDKEDALSDGTCLNTMFPQVLSLDNHDDELDALDASCAGIGGSTIHQDAQTLCCP